MNKAMAISMKTTTIVATAAEKIGIIPEQQDYLMNLHIGGLSAQIWIFH